VVDLADYASFFIACQNSLSYCMVTTGCKTCHHCILKPLYYEYVGCHQQGHAGSKTLHQQNPPVRNWMCWLVPAHPVTNWRIGLYRLACIMAIKWWLLLLYSKKVKVAHTRLPSIGFWSWSRFLAFSLQVMWIINPAVDCHYFPPGLQLPLQPLRGLLPVWLLGEQRHNGCEQFA